jgi:uncharacterized protein YecT (DUF1311 family)
VFELVPSLTIMKGRTFRSGVLIIAILFLSAFLVWKFVLGSGFIGEFSIGLGKWFSKTQDTPPSTVSTIDAQAKNCDKERSNVEIRQCYSREKDQVDRKIDSLVVEITADVRREADEYARHGDGVFAASLRKTIPRILESQRTWKTYRGEHCAAIGEMILGSGAGTAYETCELRLGEQRLKELRSEFGTNRL